MTLERRGYLLCLAGSGGYVCLLHDLHDVAGVLNGDLGLVAADYALGQVNEARGNTPRLPSTGQSVHASESFRYR